MQRSFYKMVEVFLYIQICLAPLWVHSVNAGESNRWSLGVSTGVISDNNTMEAAIGAFDAAESDKGGGRLYLFHMDYRLASYGIDLFSNTYNLDLEIVSTLGIVDEKARDPFLNCNTAVGLRWMNFPWNRYVSTTVMTGLGLNYSEKIFLLDTLKHPGDNRSHLKFFWPLEITFALPVYKSHRLVLFNHHISGGKLFDKGGMDSFGIGYRYLFQ